MAGAYKRPSDKKRGATGKWTGWYLKADGKKASFAGTTDKTYTLRMAQAKEAEEKMVREGILDPKDQAAKNAARRPIGEHIEDYRSHLLSKGDKPKHANHIAGALRRLMEAASVGVTTDITSEVIQGAAGRKVKAGDSARTGNHAIGAARAFTKWLHANNRLKEDPLRTLTSRFSEASDVRYLRRDLSAAEMGRLLAAAESGPDYPAARRGRRRDSRPRIPGHERGMAYRIAMGTGFRASEMATLTPESFDLGDTPTVTVEAAYTKNKKEAVQPILPELAAVLRGWLAGKTPGQPVLSLPEKTAKMIRFDLALAGIPDVQKTTIRTFGDRKVKIVDGVVDFHALRASYITHIVESGASIKTAQELARHSTPNLTIGRYTKTDDRRKREALEGLRGSIGAVPRAANEES